MRILLQWWRLALIFEPRDVWVGVYLGPHAVYVCVVPTLALRWEHRRLNWPIVMRQLVRQERTDETGSDVRPNG